MLGVQLAVHRNGGICQKQYRINAKNVQLIYDVHNFILLQSKVNNMGNNQNIVEKCITAPNLEEKAGLICKAYGYYLKGLTARETAILLNVSERTIQRWKSEHRFADTAQPKAMHQRAVELKKLGLSYREIARSLKVSRTSVYNYLKRGKQLVTVAG